MIPYATSGQQTFTWETALRKAPEGVCMHIDRTGLQFCGRPAPCPDHRDALTAPQNDEEAGPH